MYAIKRSDGYFLSDGAVYTDGIPAPFWQLFNGPRCVYSDNSLWHITLIKDRLAKIYTSHTLSIYELNTEQLEYLTFRKLKGE